MNPEDISKLLDDIVAADLSNGDVFARLLDRSIPLLALNYREVAEHFEVEPSTVLHWREGTFSPTEDVRRVVMNWIRLRAVERLPIESKVYDSNPPKGRLLEINVICRSSSELKYN